MNAVQRAILATFLLVCSAAFFAGCAKPDDEPPSDYVDQTPPTSTTVAAGAYHTLALKSDGSLWAWGWNDEGQLGLGDTITRFSPTQVGTATDWTLPAAGWLHSLALKGDGSLWAWGYSDDGQLGLGDTITRFSPTRVGTDTDWTVLAAGALHTLALKSDGSLWAWGRNDIFQLGQGGDFFDRSSPTRVGTATDWTLPAAAEGHSLALKSDGSLWAWGYNFEGQLGLGDTRTRSSPTRVGTATDWTVLAAGYLHTLALKGDVLFNRNKSVGPSLWAWGLNNAGQLGLGDFTDRSSPTRVGTAPDWTALAAGVLHTLSLKSDGSLWAWGSNSYGQLGLGLLTFSRTSPRQVGTATDWTALAADGWHSLALKSDGSLWAWGLNDHGQLGLGDLTDRNSPTEVSY